MNGHIRIGSNAKAFVSVVILQLVAEGKVSLDGRRSGMCLLSRTSASL
ncbi:hypothetical protein [Kibdelosporangium philippinense]